jgi:DNA polymerase-3 subunit chi
MPEFRFHHLERRRLDEALPELLEAMLAEGARVVVQTGSPEHTDALDEHLWTYAEVSFLPHGAARDGDPEAQPIYLTAGDDDPNGATVRVLLAGANVARLIGSSYRRVMILFDGRDADATAEARRQWALVKAAGESLNYWREGDDGGWVKAR